MAGHVHTVPCDPTLTADEAWHELCVFGRRVTFSGLGEYWAVVECDGDECASIETAEAS